MTDDRRIAPIEVVDETVATILRKKSGMERLRMAHEAAELVRVRLIAYLKATHPDWDEARVRQEVIARMSGESS